MRNEKEERMHVIVIDTETNGLFSKTHTPQRTFVLVFLEKYI